MDCHIQEMPDGRKFLITKEGRTGPFTTSEIEEIHHATGEYVHG